MANVTEVSKIMAILAAAYPRFNSNANTVAAYFELLKDIPADALKAAALHCANSSEFFPSVYELRAAVADIQRQAQNIPNMYDAWAEVCNHPKEQEGSVLVQNGDDVYFQNYPLPFSHPLIDKVAKSLGWPKFPSSDEIGVDRAHFFKAYDHMLKDAMKESVKLPEVRAYIEAQQKKLLESGK